MGMTIFRNNIPVILVDKHIGYDDLYGRGIMGDDFVRELNAIENNGYKTCEVWINTVGGSVIDGLAIYNAIANSTIEVNTRNVGVSLSTGGWLMQAGKKRIANYYTKLMMHPTSGGDEKTLDALNTTVSSMLAIRCKKSEAWIQERMKDETWIDAEQGLKLGLYDEIDYSCGAEVKESFDNKKPFAAYNAMMAVVNKLVETPTKKTMKKVTNLLNLNEDATEDSIVKEINTLKAQAEDLKNKLAVKEAELLKVESDKVAAEKEKEAVEFIENACKEGRFAEAAKEGFLTLAKNNLEATKIAVNAMPIKAIANKLPLGNGHATGDAGRATWDYDKWQKEDPTGLINMHKNSPAEYDALLTKWKNTLNIK